jgi:hypothetical protein
MAVVYWRIGKYPIFDASPWGHAAIYYYGQKDLNELTWKCNESIWLVPGTFE